MIEEAHPGTSDRRARWLLVVIGGLLLGVLASAVVTVALRGGDRKGAGTAAEDYYTALSHDDAATAYALLCARDQTGLSGYASAVRVDRATGTAIASFRLDGTEKVRGDEAAVPAQIVLADRTETPIIVLLVKQSGTWKVCSSDLGGILPPPGPAGSPTGPVPSAAPTVDA